MTQAGRQVAPTATLPVWVRVLVPGMIAIGCRLPAEPPEGFETRSPAAATSAEAPVEAPAADGAPRIDPFAAAEAERRAAAKARSVVEDPAACLVDFSRANGYGIPPDRLRGMQGTCDRAGLPANVCRPEDWLTREAAECLAVTRSMEPGAEVESELGVDRRRGLMIWTVRGRLETANALREWTVELRADTGAVVGMRQRHQLSSQRRSP